MNLLKNYTLLEDNTLKVNNEDFELNQKKIKEEAFYFIEHVNPSIEDLNKTRE